MIFFLSITVVLILANSADPDEMLHFVAFHQGLQCLPENTFGGFQYTLLKNKVLEFRKNIPCETICDYSAIQKVKLRNYIEKIMSLMVSRDKLVIFLLLKRVHTK